MLRVAVVGFGKMGILHASLLSVLPDVELAAICEKNRLIRRFGKNIFKGVEMVGDVRALSNFGLDAAYVTTPPSTHFPILKAIYSAGIARNVFVEKPLASNSAESEELYKLAAKQGINMVGYNRRFGVTYRKAKQILDEGTLGGLVHFKAHAYSSDFLDHQASMNQTRAGTVLRDLGCHAIHLAIWFFGKLNVISPSGLPSRSGPGDYVYFTATTVGGVEGEFENSRCMKNYRLPEVSLAVKGSKGMMDVNDDGLELKLDNGTSSSFRRHDLKDNVAFFLGGTDYFREDETFVKAILEGRSVESSDFLMALEVDRVIDQVVNGAPENG